VKARPVDIARQLKLSTTSLRHYEDRGLIPPVARSAAGYRMFTEEHLAYFVCIRDMRAGFSMTQIAKILQAVMANNIAAALWMVNQAQADLNREKRIAEKIVLNLVHRNELPDDRTYSIHQVSQQTGVPATAIRYWDKVGLISVKRERENNYRRFTAQHIRQILTIYALKFSVYGNRRQYSIERVKAELAEFDADDSDRLSAIARDMEQRLAQVNRAQIRGIAALYHLCIQVESGDFGQAQV
jgi:DNA-binding transcriptional MerR regulator